MADARLRGRRTPLVLSVSRKSPKPQTHWALASAGAFFASRFIVGFVAMPRGRATETLPVETLRLLAQPCPFACARIAHRATLSGIGIGGDLVIAADQSRLLPATSSAVRFEPCSRLGCRTVTSSCSRFSCSPFSYGAVEILFWPSLHWW